MTTLHDSHSFLNLNQGVDAYVFNTEIQVDCLWAIGCKLENLSKTGYGALKENVFLVRRDN